MPSETDVANAALRLIGGTRITSFTDGSDNANAVQDLYTELRDDLLRSHPWNFATKRVQLAQSVTTPSFEFDYAYPVPSDWLRTMSVHNNDAGDGTIFFKEEEVGDQRVITASANQVYLRYIARVTDPNKMPADFRRAFETALASDLAVPVANSNKLNEIMAKRSERALARARSSDSMGASPERRPRGSWVTSRGGRWPRVASEGD